MQLRRYGAVSASHQGSRRLCCRVRARSTSPLLYAECTSAMTPGKMLHAPPVRVSHPWSLSLALRLGLHAYAEC